LLSRRVDAGLDKAKPRDATQTAGKRTRINVQD
jgi:hypothetical protein